MSDPITRLDAALSGRYRIERKLGEGGMATVYLADDLRHNRNVALKVLKPELAAVVGADRFLAEIQVTAQLQHPNILPLFDSGEAAGLLYYVMPYVEGESLRERLDREKQLPVGEALKLAGEAADALEHAHQRGVIHRDIKPANLLLSGGRPLIADFGIALAVSAAGGGRLTETGLSVGTPYYMSPEQAAADREASPASDVYSLACVLYEMLIGEPPHTGATAQAVLAKILTEAPTPARSLRSSVPANVDAAIRQALEKLPADRFATAKDFATALTDARFRYGEVEGPVAMASGSWKTLTLAGWSVAALVTVALGWTVLRPEDPPRVARFTPVLENLVPWEFTLTPDGSAVVYVGSDETAGTRLWVRRWRDLEADPIPGTEGAGGAVSVSPDGSNVVFSVGSPGPLRVVPIEGGPGRTVVDSPAYQSQWAADGWIYFVSVTDRPRLDRIPQDGSGPVDTLIAVSGGELIQWWPHALPGGRMLLIETLVSGSGGVVPEIRVLDLETREQRRLTQGREPSYAPSGHLLFVTEDGTLMARPFDPSRAEFTGPAASVVDGLLGLGSNSPSYELSRDGTLIYVALGGRDTERELLWVTRAGAVDPVDPADTIHWALSYGEKGLHVSPDGERVAYTSNLNGQTDIWTKPLSGGPPQRLTFHEAGDQNPVWTPDGRAVTYSSLVDADTSRAVGSQWRLWSVSANGTSEPEFLYGSNREPAGIGVWSPDGTWLVIRKNASGGTSDLLALRPGRDSVAAPLVASPEFNERYPALSRDGRWLAYVSDETSQSEVFVRPFPNVNDDKKQVSSGGGEQPVWAHNGRELFFVNPATEQIMTAEYTTEGSAFRLDGVAPLLRAPDGAFGVFNGRGYDVAPDDERFLMTRPLGGTASLVLIQNFFEVLAERVGPPSR